jgi:hypothetical protein
MPYIPGAWKLQNSRNSFLRELRVGAVIRRPPFVALEEKTLVAQQGMERVVDSH